MGALPASAVGVGGPRRSRFVILIVGLCIGLGLVTGAALGRYWPLALGGIFVLCLGTAVLWAHAKDWATAACLLVMRPTPEMTRLRGAGRAISVTAGALAACALALTTPDSAAIAIAVVAAMTGLAAVRTSRWYISGGFTTFIVILLLVYGTPDQAPSRFLERFWETGLGVCAALLFGVAIPAMRRPVTNAE